MALYRSNRLHSVLIYAIKLRQLLTGEGYVLLKIFGDSLRRHGCLTMPAGVKRSHSSISSFIQERKNDEKILGLTRKIIQLLTREVPVRYEDIAVFFTMEEWEYVEGHQDLYADVLVENTTHLRSISDHDNKILRNTSSEKISDSKTVHQDRNRVTVKILHLTKEIIHLLTKEKYILIWNPGNRTTPSGTDRVSGLITESSPPSLIQEKKNDGKILNLTNKIFELLNGETSIRYEDIKVCFSMEEWEYVEQHKNLYRDIMMDSEIVEFYDTSCSLDLTEEKPVECLKHCRDYSYQVAESTKSCHNQPNIGKHKHKNNIKEQTPVLCCKCEQPLKRTDDGHRETGSKKFCRKCLLDKRCKNTQKRRFSCLECSSSFSNKSALDLHLRIHTLSKIFTCSECDKVFSNNAILETHMRVHTGEKPYKCSECGKYFSNTGNLQAHYRVHTGEKPFPCSECNKTFRYKSHLVAHQRVHTGQTLPCSECGKQFVYRSHLVKHLRIHTGEKPYKCPECGKCFHRSSQLIQHEMIHTGESPFKCEECDKYFRFPSDLFRHQKTHTGEKPFCCSECGKSFTRSTSLTEHTKLHTGEKPYSCPECGKHFITYNYMLRHLTIHNSKKKVSLNAKNSKQSD